MMKRVVFSLFALGLLSSCIRPEADSPGKDVYILTASLESEEETRTYLSGSGDGVYYPFWSGEEEIAVFINGRDVASRFTFVSGKDTREATFSGLEKGNHYVALYPSGIENELKGNDLSLTLPAEQPYVPSSFAEGAFPMLAVSASSTLSFKNLCAVLKVSLTGRSSVQSIVFTANDPGTSVSGRAVVRIDQSDDPTLSMAEGGSSSVRLVTEDVDLSESVPTDFFIVIPPGIYKGGFTLKVKTSEGTDTRSTAEDIVFGRSQIRWIPPFDCTEATIDPEDIPNNVLLYTTASGKACHFLTSKPFDREIISNTYEDGIGKIVFDGPLKRIGYAFTHSDVEEVTLPSSVEFLSSSSFWNSTVRTVRLSENLQTVQKKAFDQCPKLESFSGPHATSDGKGILIDGELVAYVGVVDEKIVIPEGVVDIPDDIFMSLTDEAKRKVKEIVFPEGMIRFGNFARISTQCCFENLEYVTLPSTFINTDESYGSFWGCPSLKKFKGNNPWIRDDGNCLIDANGRLFGYAGAGITAYAVPEGVLSIAGYVFSGQNDLHGLSYPSSVKSFSRPVMGGENLRYFFGPLASEDGMSLVQDGKVMASILNLEEYISPEGITRFGSSVFLCSSVKRIIIRDCVTDFDGDAFYWVEGLETLVLSKNLVSLGNYSFGNNLNLHTIYFRSPTPPACGSNAYNDFPEDFVAYVPKGSLEAYENAPQLSFLPRNFKEYEVEDDEVVDWYVSKDYSMDGKVDVLQRAQEGNGIDLVLMGDAFSDRQVKDGTYARVMERMMEAFFSEEPYRSYRDLFNVYSVDVVSQTEGYAHPGRALGTRFKGGTEVAGSDQACLNYARRAVSDDRMDNVLVLVAMDSTAYAGTCYMYYPSVESGDWGAGPSIAYFPLGDPEEAIDRLVHHEAGGHGFAKLADEYSYESNGVIPQEEIVNYNKRVPFGWWRNVDFTDDPSTVKWGRFLSDERYRFDGIGVFEGACTYWKGAWRPTENSIMRHNTGGFNAPSREAIWYRMHKLAYGKSWQYDFEEFAQYDARNRKGATGASVARRSNSVEIPDSPLHPPVVVNRRWNDLMVD